MRDVAACGSPGDDTAHRSHVGTEREGVSTPPRARLVACLEEEENGRERSDRHELYAKLEEVIGKERAETIMSLLPPVGWVDVATKHHLTQLERRLDAKFEAVDAKLDAVESRLSARIFRTALVVNIPTILASFALAFTAVRLA